ELAAIVPRIYCTRGIGARQEEFVSVAAANHFENFLHFYVRGRISVEQTGFRDITACLYLLKCISKEHSCPYFDADFIFWFCHVSRLFAEPRKQTSQQTMKSIYCSLRLNVLLGNTNPCSIKRSRYLARKEKRL